MSETGNEAIAERHWSDQFQTGPVPSSVIVFTFGALAGLRNGALLPAVVVGLALNAMPSADRELPNWVAGVFLFGVAAVPAFVSGGAIALLLLRPARRDGGARLLTQGLLFGLAAAVPWLSIGRDAFLRAREGMLTGAVFLLCGALAGAAASRVSASFARRPAT